MSVDGASAAAGMGADEAVALVGCDTVGATAFGVDATAAGVVGVCVDIVAALSTVGCWPAIVGELVGLSASVSVAAVGVDAGLTFGVAGGVAAAAQAGVAVGGYAVVAPNAAVGVAARWRGSSPSRCAPGSRWAPLSERPPPCRKSTRRGWRGSEQPPPMPEGGPSGGGGAPAPCWPLAWTLLPSPRRLRLPPPPPPPPWVMSRAAGWRSAGETPAPGGGERGRTTQRHGGARPGERSPPCAAPPARPRQAGRG